MRILILSAGAGSGHNRAAQALLRTFESEDGIEAVQYVDCLDRMNKPFRDIYSKYYLQAVKTAPTLWGWAFEKTDVPWKKAHARESIEWINARGLVEDIIEFAPTDCVCTHFMPAAIVSRLLREKDLSTRLSVAVTDFYVHASWLTPAFHRYFVPHEEGRAQLLAYGFPEDRVIVSGIPIDPRFRERNDKRSLVAEFGLSSDLPIVLFSAGAAGSMAAKEMMEMIRSIQTPCQTVVICGKNEHLKKELETLNGSNKNILVLGYTTEMHKWTTVADLFVGKPGGLTTSECLAKGLPLVVWDPIPGQEVFNCMYLLENGAAIAPSSKWTFGFKIDQVLGDSKRLQTMKENARNLGNPDAAERIVKRVVSGVDETLISLDSV